MISPEWKLEMYFHNILYVMTVFLSNSGVLLN